MRKKTNDLNASDKSNESAAAKKVSNEIKRLSNNFKNIDGEKRKIVLPLIERAAFMRVSLEQFEKDLQENGFTEPFSQGMQEPYDRKRPVAEIYNSMNVSYQKIIKQLTDLLPKDDGTKKIKDDGFDDFVNGREEI